MDKLSSSAANGTMFHWPTWYNTLSLICTQLHISDDVENKFFYKISSDIEK